MAYLGQPIENDIQVNRYEYVVGTPTDLYDGSLHTFPCVYSGSVEVSLQGIELSKTDYIATSGVDITLFVDAVVGQIVQIKGFYKVLDNNAETQTFDPTGTPLIATTTHNAIMEVAQKGSARNTVLSTVAAGVLAQAVTPTPSFATRTYVGNGTSQNIIMGVGDGTELITNGTFDSDILGWSDISSGTASISWSAGALSLNGIDASNRARTEQAITTLIDKPFLLSVGIGGTVSVQVWTGSGQTGTLLGVYNSLAAGSYQLSFKSVGVTTAYVFFESLSSSNIDNVSVREITQPIKSFDPNWVSGRAYSLANEQDAYCIHNYYIYKLLADVTSATTPDADPTKWEQQADGVSVPWFNSQVWIKNRDAIESHAIFDTFRGGSLRLNTDSTAAESTLATLEFNATGVNFTSSNYNTTGINRVIWQEQFDTMVSGTTNQGKRYITASNAQSGKGMSIYVGSGLAGHEIPHGLGTKPNSYIFKNRVNITNWEAGYDGNGYWRGDTNEALTEQAGRYYLSDSSFSLDTLSTWSNTLNDNYVAYFSSNRDNHTVTKMYQGTGIAGNVVDLGLDMTQAGAKVMIKALSTTGSWVLEDNIRTDAYLLADSSAAETANDTLDFTTTGIILKGLTVNASGVTYLIEATVPNYDKPNGGLNRPAGNILSYAEGVDGTTGDLDSIETTTSVDFLLTAGAKNYLFADKGNTVVASTVKMLKGLDRVSADKWGVVSPSDATLKTTAKHSDYVSATGVVSASSETATYEAWEAFDKNSGFEGSAWASSTGTTTGWLQYKFSETRKVVSYSIAPRTTSNAPSAWTTEISNNGVDWTTVDTRSSETSWTVGLYNDYTIAIPGDSKYIRINITAVNGGTLINIAEFRLNTEHPAGDFYNVENGLTVDSTDTPTSRIPLGEVVVDALGEAILDTLVVYPKTNDLVDLEVHRNAKFHSGFDLGQTWVDELSNRLKGVTYKNEEGYTIFIAAECAAGTDSYLEIFVNGESIIINRSRDANASIASACVPVPVDGTYLVNTSTLSIAKWKEYK